VEEPKVTILLDPQKFYMPSFFSVSHTKEEFWTSFDIVAKNIRGKVIAARAFNLFT